MKDEDKTKVQLINELEKLRQQVAQFEKSEKNSKQAERALQESENKYRALVENLPQKIFIKDKNSVYIACNGNYARDLKIKPDEIVGKTDYDFYPKKLADKYRTDDKGIMVSKKTEDIEEKYIQDGQEVWVHTVKTPIKDKKGDSIGILGIFWDITERKRADEELKGREEFNYALFEHNPMASMVVDFEGKITGFNLAKRNSGDRLPHIDDVMFKDYAGRHEIDMYAEMMECIRSGEIKHFPEQRYGDKILSIIISPFPKGAVIISHDVTESKQAEEQIRTALKEKEVLLREIHHRVKNNLQIISSMLNLQRSSTKNDQVIEIFKESQNRIKTMVLIHEKLYRSEDLSHIDVKEYVKSLASSLVRSLSIRVGKIAVTTEIDDITLNIDEIIPCGMIINELVSNSLKYAFPNRKKGNINIKMKLTNEKLIEVTVKDDGIGMPKNLDFRNTESFGLQLVTMLAEGQLRGEVHLKRNGGTEFRIRFSGAK